MAEDLKNMDSFFNNIKELFEENEASFSNAELEQSWNSVQSGISAPNTSIQSNQAGKVVKTLFSKTSVWIGAGIVSVATVGALILVQPKKDTQIQKLDFSNQIENNNPASKSTPGSNFQEQENPINQANQASTISDTKNPMPGESVNINNSYNPFQPNSENNNTFPQVDPKGNLNNPAISFPDIIVSRNARRADCIYIYDTSICKGDSFRFKFYSKKATFSGLFVIMPGGEIKPIDKYLSIYLPNAGNYYVRIGYKESNQTIYHIQVLQVVSHPVAKFSFKNLPDKTIQFINQSGFSGDYRWEFDDKSTSTLENPLHQYYQTGKYNVAFTITNSTGCSGRTEQTVSVNDLTNQELPNIFTPNGDGVNDKFVIKIENVEFFEINIVDRSGRTVYSSSSTDGWEGTDQKTGLPCSEGTYYFSLKYKQTGDSEIVSKTGALRLEK